jgi:NAD(P)-dependent dehydrogenase (short-subunit alcohol dehydrogenase family)|tara:strand:+ start:190 stop:975 length:786 start_codon:yes stop_codon:yes gene_type:complete
MSGKLDGKKAIVVGGGGGIGGAIVQRFYAEGASVCVIDAIGAAAQRTVDALGGQGDGGDADGGGTVFPLAADIGDEAATIKAVADAVEKLGGLDITVHSAATREPTATVEETELAHWDEALRVNLTGIFLLCKHAIPHLRASGGGVIINIASQLGTAVTSGRPAYHATKAAVIHLTKAIAIENAADNIRAITVSPGAIETDRLLHRYDDMQMVRDLLTPAHPIGRLGLPEDIAGAVLFAASDDAAFMTGTDMIVDGGYTAV